MLFINIFVNFVKTYNYLYEAFIFKNFKYSDFYIFLGFINSSKVSKTLFQEIYISRNDPYLRSGPRKRFRCSPCHSRTSGNSTIILN